MQQKYPFILPFIIFMALALIWPVGGVMSQTPTPNKPTSVGLVSFTAVTHSSGVLLTWETATELNTAGFVIHRRTGSGNFTYLEEIGFVGAEGGPAQGYIYQEIDITAVLGQTYTYRLIEVENSSNELTLGEVSITVGATATPTATNSPTPTATTQAINPTSTTASGVATVTPTPTATATTTGSAAPPTAVTQPTATRIIFATVTPAAAPPTTLSTATPSEADSAAQPISQPGSQQPTAEPTRPGATGGPGAFAPSSALAQPAETAAPVQDAPVDNSANDSAADPNSQINTGYPVDAQPSPAPSPTTSGVAVIGSSQGYTGANSGAAADQTNEGPGTLFLWLGFIVALLIFITGIIGSIILYTRKSG
ncbi:MAG: hypothetical protein IPM39_08185 [Chloroflexi bacterium]|nr:hypothetical protein [Chloroflexota bacterium]